MVHVVLHRRAKLAAILLIGAAVSWMGSVICPPASLNIPEKNEAMGYLSRFGYLNLTNSDLRFGAFMDERSFEEAIREFQEFAQLKITGQLNEETKRMMKVPRCGVKDKRFSASAAKLTRLRRFVIHGSRWKVRNLSYKISKYSSDLGRTETDEEVKRAFSEWEKISPLKFDKKSSGRVQIEIRFESGNHDDGDPFDGPGGTLAHAYFPQGGGDVHFDDDERWSINSKRGTNLFQVAVHELGHALGLEHSKVRTAVMYPFYRGYNSHFEFDNDDIDGIQSLYGAKESEFDEKEEPNNRDDIGGKLFPSPGLPDLCQDGKLDAIFDYQDGSTYILKGSFYWLLDDSGIVEGYPKLISHKWIGLPSNIDAAFTGFDDRIYFFKGSKYWRYNGKMVDGDYPKEISEGFAGIPDNVDAAMWVKYLNKAFFYKGDKYWVYNAKTTPHVKSTYPKSVNDFKGIPANLDDVLHDGGRVFFFKNGSYYKLSDLYLEYRSDDILPPEPKNTRTYLFGCTSNS